MDVPKHMFQEQLSDIDVGGNSIKFFSYFSHRLEIKLLVTVLMF